MSSDPAGETIDVGPVVVGNEHIDSIGRDLLHSFDDVKSAPEYPEPEPEEEIAEQRRAAAITVAQHVAHDDVRKLITDASLVYDYLKTGQLPTDDPA